MIFHSYHLEAENSVFWLSENILAIVSWGQFLKKTEYSSVQGHACENCLDVLKVKAVWNRTLRFLRGLLSVFLSGQCCETICGAMVWWSRISSFVWSLVLMVRNWYLLQIMFVSCAKIIQLWFQLIADMNVYNVVSLAIRILALVSSLAIFLIRQTGVYDGSDWLFPNDSGPISCPKFHPNYILGNHRSWMNALLRDESLAT